MNSQQIAAEMETVLRRYRAGLLTQEQAKLELAVLQSMLKAVEQAILEEKLERIEAVLEGRQ